MFGVDPKPPPPTEADPDDAGKPLRADKKRRLLNLGFAHPDADMLAEHLVDVTELERLIRSGCPPQTAARIVAPN